jgi:hypothetical protein
VAVTAAVIEQKLAGCRDFDHAFSVALKRYPPGSTDRRVLPPFEEADLFHQELEVELSLVDWTRQHLSDAWHGRNRGVAMFTLDSLREDDWSSPAGLANRHGTAA